MKKTIQPIERAAGAAAATSEALADHAEHGIDVTRALANSALDGADAGVQHLRENVPPAIEALSERAQSLAGQAQELAARTRDQAQQRLADAADRASARVADKPLQSMALAAAAGALLAFLLARRR